MFESAKAFNPVLLFVVALEPDLSIRMQEGKSLEERGRAIPVQVYSTDNIGNWIKGGRWGGQHRRK
jgi:hypothetical protein